MLTVSSGTIWFKSRNTIITNKDAFGLLLYKEKINFNLLRRIYCVNWTTSQSDSSGTDNIKRFSATRWVSSDLPWKRNAKHRPLCNKEYKCAYIRDYLKFMLTKSFLRAKKKIFLFTFNVFLDIYFVSQDILNYT